MLRASYCKTEAMLQFSQGTYPNTLNPKDQNPKVFITKLLVKWCAQFLDNLTWLTKNKENISLLH